MPVCNLKICICRLSHPIVKYKSRKALNFIKQYA